MSYIGNSPGVASQRVTTTLTATAGQTQFTTQSGYVLGYVDVYLNGAKLVNGSDFEAITGTYITLFAGAAAGDVVELISYVPRGLSDGYTKAEADAKFLDVGGDTASGSLALATASLSGNLTLSGGTANGVGYLNGSKVLTTDNGLTFDGNALTLGGTAPFIRANMTGTQSTRLGIQNSTTNGNTRFFLYPNGTGNISAINGWNNSNPSATDYQSFDLGVIGTSDVRLSSNASGSASYLPLTFWNGGGEKMRLTSAGFLGVGTNSPGFILDVVGTSGRFSVNPGYFTGFSTGLSSYIKRLYGGAVVDDFSFIGDMYYENSGTWKTPLTSYSATTYGNGATIFYGGTGVTANTAFYPTERMRIAANGDLNVGTTVGGARLIVGTAETKGQNATPFSLTTSDGSNRFELVVARSTNAYYSFQAVEQNVAYRNIVFQQDGGNVGIGQTNPTQKLEVNGNVFVHTATGNPWLAIKTDGAGNNPVLRLQADSSYWDIQGTFSNTHDDLQFLYSGTNKFAFSNNSIGGLSISNGNNQYGRLTVDTDGHQHVVRGGSLNGSDYYYRFLKLFKLRTSAGSGSSTEVKGRLHLSRVNEIGVSAKVDFYATQGYSGQIRTWYKRVAGPEGTGNFRFVTLVDGGNTYLCLEFISAPGWNSWQFEGSVIDFDGARGSFAVTSVENLTTKEVGPWTSTGADPSTALSNDSTYGGLVVGLFNYEYLPGGTNTVIANTHIFGAPQNSGGYGEALRITSNGRVGIGQSAPSAPLHVRGVTNDTITASSSNFKLEAAGGDGIAMGSFASSPWGSWIQSGYLTDGYNPAFNSGYPLILNPGGGNVSIGSNRNPGAKLTVGGNLLLENTNIGNLASNALGSVPYGISRYTFNIQGDNTWRTLVTNFNDVHGEFLVFLSDSSSGDVARYFVSTTSVPYGVANMQQMQYMDGGWNTGAFEFQFRNINGTYALEVRYSSYYSSSSQGYGNIEFRRL